jgi:hypothetical protein
VAAFLFQLELPEINDSIAATIPAHRLHINNLFSQGRILSYSVAGNRGFIWCVLNAEDEQEAMELVLAFPLYRYFSDVTCHPLLFHNTLPAPTPGMSLN